MVDGNKKITLLYYVFYNVYSQLKTDVKLTKYVHNSVHDCHGKFPLNESGK